METDMWWYKAGENTDLSISDALTIELRWRWDWSEDDSGEKILFNPNVCGGMFAVSRKTWMGNVYIFQLFLNIGM